MDSLLELPWFLDHRETNPRREEFLAAKAERDKLRTDDQRRIEQRIRTLQAKEARKAEQCRIERERLAIEKAERRAIRQARKANREQRVKDREIVISLMRCLKSSGKPETVGQMTKASPLDRKRIESALRWLKKNGRITVEGRRYVECWYVEC